MASFNIEEGADTDPSWYGTFYKPGDQDWWDKGAHKALGQSFLRALVRQVAPELGTAEAGDLGMSDARCDMAVPIAFPDILSAAGAGLCILRAPEENITSMEELLPTNRVVREWVSRSKVRGDARAALVTRTPTLPNRPMQRRRRRLPLMDRSKSHHRQLPRSRR